MALAGFTFPSARANGRGQEENRLYRPVAVRWHDGLARQRFVGPTGGTSVPNTFHYTDKQGWNGIHSHKDWLFKATQPKDPERPVGAYFTDIEPTEESLRTLHKRIRVPKVKQEYVFWFVGREGLMQLFEGRGRDKRIFFSPVDYLVPEPRQQHGGKTEKLLGEFQ